MSYARIKNGLRCDSHQMSYARKQRPLRRDIYFTTKQGFVKGLFSHFYAGRGVVYAVPTCYNC